MSRKLLTVMMLLGSVFASQSFAQGNLKKADRWFAERSWSKAIPVYEEHVKREPSLAVYSKLGHCYRQIGFYAEAEKFYGLAAKYNKAPWDDHLNYGLMLKANGKYDQARAQFERMVPMATPEQFYSRLTPLIESCEAAKRISRDSTAWKVFLLEGINTAGSEMCPALYQRGLVFASDRKRGGLLQFTNPGTNRAFYDLFYSERYAGPRFLKVHRMQGLLNSPFHDGPVTFSPAEDVAFVTRSNYDAGKTMRDQTGLNRLTIFPYKMIGGKWVSQGRLPFSQQEVTMQHPALSPDRNILVFSSDMPGGLGGFDLYYSLWDEGANAWTEPRNMGPEVNTPFHEAFPFLLPDSSLYYSSDRPNGFGGMDIYSADARQGKWTNSRNAGPPINSSFDDFGLVFEKNGMSGFFSSNRPGGPGEDDIYGFKRYKILDVIVRDSRTQEILPNFTLEVMDVNQRKFTYVTDVNGRFRHYVTAGEDLMIMGRPDGYLPYRQGVDMRATPGSGELSYTVNLVHDVKYIVRGTVTDRETELPLAGASVRLVGPTEEQRLNAGRGGLYQAELKPNSDYTVIFTLPGYVPVIEKFSTKNDSMPRDYRINGSLRKGNFVLVEGVTVVKESGKFEPDAKVTVVNSNTGAEVFTCRTGSDGSFATFLPPGTYSVIASKGNFFSTRLDLPEMEQVTDTVVARLELIGMGMDKVVKTIYHPYRMAEFDLLGERDLTEIVYFLQDNPNVVVELSSHTDARGTDSYNLKLSQDRASKVAEYLLARGIAKERVVAKGYGETQIVNECGNGKECSEFLHSRNRRTELKVVSLKPVVPQ